MVHSTEVHCPFCHQKSEFHNAPVGSTVRCSTCRSIFRIPAEGALRVGLKVRKYKARRHSPVYYVILVLLIGGGVSGYYYGKQYLEAHKLRVPWDPLCKVEDPFKDRKDLPEAGSALGVIVRTLECWKLGTDPANSSARNTYFEAMLRYLRYTDVQDKDGHEDPAGTVKRLKDMLATTNLTHYTVKEKVTRLGASDSQWELTVEIEGRDAKTNLEKRGTLNPVLYLEKHQGWAGVKKDDAAGTEKTPAASPTQPDGKEGYWVDSNSLNPTWSD